MWHPSSEDIAALSEKAIRVVYLYGTQPWMGPRKHNYGHLVRSELAPGHYSIKDVLNVNGVLPQEERRKAAMRLMSWCTFRMPPAYREVLQALSELTSLPNTQDIDLVAKAGELQFMVEDTLGLKRTLIGALSWRLQSHELREYRGAITEFLVELPLPIIIYLLDYFLPQLNPTETCVDSLDYFAAPIHYGPRTMVMKYQRHDADFAYYNFENHGYSPMIMTPSFAEKRTDVVNYIKDFEGKAFEVGRMISIVFSTEDGHNDRKAIFGLIMEVHRRNKPERLKNAQPTQAQLAEYGISVTLHKCNAQSYDLALLMGGALEHFTAGPKSMLKWKFSNVEVFDLAEHRIPGQIFVHDVFALGTTKPAHELVAVAHAPSSRVPRGLGIQCMQAPAMAMEASMRTVMQSLLSKLLRRFLTPAHQVLPLPHDDWFRDRVLPIVAEKDAHALATVSAVAFALATGRLDLSIQGLFGAGKSRAAAILLAGLMALDTERRCRYQVICKENNGTRSFVGVLQYLRLPAVVWDRIGRLVADSEAQKFGQSTSRDLSHATRTTQLPNKDLLIMTGGTRTSDRTSFFSQLEKWQANLVMGIIDEAQQFGTDREVTTVAMTPPGVFMVWTGDARQTPGGVSKSKDSQIARSRQQLMFRKHGLRSQQVDLVPHSLHQALLRLCEEHEVEDRQQFQKLFQSTTESHASLWTHQATDQQQACLQRLAHLSPGGAVQWPEPTADDHQRYTAEAAECLLGNTLSHTSIAAFAYICAGLDAHPEWVAALQATTNLATAGVQGPHAWGLMLPTSTRTAGITYSAIVGVRYDILCTLKGGEWQIGTHTLGGVDGLVGGFQFVHWLRPQISFKYSRCTDLKAVVDQVWWQLRRRIADSSLLVMCARNDDRDSLQAEDLCKENKSLTVQSVASSAGGTATMAIVAQSERGHLNGYQSHPFDQEECFARCTVAATRAQSLTVVVAQLDMMGIMGLLQVLGARHQPVYEVDKGSTAWELPLLPTNETQIQQSQRDIATWRISEAGPWTSYAHPPLAIAVALGKYIDGVRNATPTRLRLILLRANVVQGAAGLITKMQRLAQAKDPDNQFIWWPQQHTREPLIWGYAQDHYYRAVAWLGPKSEAEPGIPVLRHWLSNKAMPAQPLPGIFGLDAWRIAPQLKVTSEHIAGLEEQELPVQREPSAPPEPKSTDMADQIAVRRAQLDELDNQKTAADFAQEMQRVTDLVAVLCESQTTINQAVAAQEAYEERERNNVPANKDKKGHKRRADDIGPSAAAGKSGSPTIKSEFVDKVLPHLVHLPTNWPLIKFDLKLHNTEGYYTTWRKFLHLNEYLRSWNAGAANATIEENARVLAEHLVQFLSEWIVMALEPARLITKVRNSDFLFLHDKDYWFKQIWIDLHQATVLDRTGSGDRPPVGLVRCVCKNEKAKSGRDSAIKLRVSNVHFFVPVWMAPAIVRNFRMLKRSGAPTPGMRGALECKETWFVYQRKPATDGGSLGHESLDCLRLIVNDKYIHRFPKEDYPAIEHFAAAGVVNAQTWQSRHIWLGLTAHMDIPIGGDAFCVVNSVFGVHRPPMCWPTSMEDAWQEHLIKKDLTFQDIVGELSHSVFAATVFEGTASAQAFEWNAAMLDRWPELRLNFREMWRGQDAGDNIKKSAYYIRPQEWEKIWRSMPQYRKVAATGSEYVHALSWGYDTRKAPRQHVVLESRQGRAASASTYVHAFKFILSRTISAEYMEGVIQAMLIHCEDNLEKLADNKTLFLDTVSKILREKDIPGVNPEILHESSEELDKWISILFGKPGIGGPPDRANWHDEHGVLPH